MKNYIFLLPLYNDWKSLERLLKDINNQMRKLNEKGQILVVDDFSRNIDKINTKALNYLRTIEVLRLNRNLGSQKAISIGLKYLKNKKINSIITILDSDGEDNATKIKEMINCAKKNSDNVIVSCRSKRSEGNIFRFLYILHKVITFIFTLKWMNFGNFSSFHSKNLNKILSNNSSWFAYSSSIAKNCILYKLFAERRKRYYGKSQLSLGGLFLHSLRVNCVFLPRIILLSLIYILMFFFFIEEVYFLIILVITFNAGILYTYYYIKPSEYSKRLKFLENKIFLKKL